MTAAPCRDDGCGQPGEWLVEALTRRGRVYTPVWAGRTCEYHLVDSLAYAETRADIVGASRPDGEEAP